jgi:hypothetical protein
MMRKDFSKLTITELKKFQKGGLVGKKPVLAHNGINERY